MTVSSTDPIEEPAPVPAGARRPRRRMLLIGGISLVVVMIAAGVVYLSSHTSAGPASTGPDSGLAGCAMIQRVDVPTTADDKVILADFAGSRFGDLRAAGTAWFDHIADMPHAMKTDSGPDLATFLRATGVAQVATYVGCDKYGSYITGWTTSDSTASTESNCPGATLQLTALGSQLDESSPATATTDLTIAITNLAGDLESEQNPATGQAMEATFQDLETALATARAGHPLDQATTVRLRADATTIGGTCGTPPAPPADQACFDDGPLFTRVSLQVFEKQQNTATFRQTIDAVVAELEKDIPQETNPIVLANMQQALTAFRTAQTTIKSGRQISAAAAQKLADDSSLVIAAC